MSERVNQINEALDYWVGDDNNPPTYVVLVADAARDHADLLSRLEDGSAYQAAQERLNAMLAYFDPELRIGDIRHIEVDPIVDAALGLQEDTIAVTKPDWMRSSFEEDEK